MYYSYNGRHTVSDITDRHGDVIESYRYEAFGGIFEGITSPYNTSSYTGHQYDDVAGLMDMKARWYDPQTADFLSEDTYPGTLDAPFTQNRYAYVGNNPINMWDPTGHVPEWVRAKNDYEIESYSKTVYRDANGDGVEDDFYYSEDYREWHQFNSYSSSWGTVNHIGRASYNTYYIDYFSQTFTETWNYTYREDWYWWVSFIGPLESHPSSPETFIESTEHLWSNTVTAQELSEGVEAAKLEYGSPPANALKRVTVSLNGTQLVQHSSFDGVTVSAQVLINEEQYSSSSSAEQRIIAKTLDEANAIRKGCNCFTAGTKVLTDEGEKNIEDIEVGDKVLSKNEETGEQAFKEVTHLYLNDKEIIYELTVGDQLIETTDNHPFWVEGEGWVLAADLHVGDKLQQSNGNTLTIDNMKIVKHDELVKVYNFTVADFHTYYVSSLGIWVHNISCAEINWKGFSSGKLKPHWEKHGHEFGDISQNEYLKLAKGFAAETNFSFKEQVVGNFLVKYDPSSGRVLVGHIKDRQIRTFYKDDGRSADPFQAAIDLAKSLGGS